MPTTVNLLLPDPVHPTLILTTHKPETAPVLATAEYRHLQTEV